MAWPESLTADEQAAFLAFTTNLRSWSAQLARLNILGNAIASAWSGGISTLNGKLQGGDVIPNASSLAGSQDLSQADVGNLAAWAQSLCNPANADQGTGSYASGLIQSTLVKAAGINASITS
jgi:hypothetical protein